MFFCFRTASLGGSGLMMIWEVKPRAWNTRDKIAVAANAFIYQVQIILADKDNFLAVIANARCSS